MVENLDDLLPLDDTHAMVDAGVLVGAAELGQRVDPLAAFFVGDGDAATADLGDLALAGGLDEVGRIASCTGSARRSSSVATTTPSRSERSEAKSSR